MYGVRRRLAVRARAPARERVTPCGTSSPAPLHKGETIKTVSEYLGHADPISTLRTYTHLMEGSSERTKRATDAVFGTHSKCEEDADPGEDEEDEEATE